MDKKSPTAPVRHQFGTQSLLSLAAAEEVQRHNWPVSVVLLRRASLQNCWYACFLYICVCPYAAHPTAFWNSAVQARTGSEYLINLRTCPDGSSVPQRTPVPASEMQRHRHVCARSCALPDDVTAIHAPKLECTGACSICGSESEDEDVRLLCCGHCRVMVHNTCYDCAVPPIGAAWLCELCCAGVQQPPPCVLCPVLGGGPMRYTRCGNWAHVVCCLWIPGCVLEPGSPPFLDQVR